MGDYRPRRIVEVVDRDYAQVVYLTPTEQMVPVPTVREAVGQHTVARVLRRAGYNTLPPYRPERTDRS